MTEPNFTEIDRAYEAVKNKIATQHRVVTDDMAIVEKEAKAFVDRMKTLQAEIDAAAWALEKQGDTTYNRMKDAINAANNRIDELLKANDRHNAWALPMDIKQMIDLATRLE